MSSRLSWKWTWAGTARWWCVGLAVLLDAASWVPSSFDENFSVRGDFALGVDTGSDSVPPKTLSDESINRGLVCHTCIPLHLLKRSWHSCPRRVNAGKQKHTQYAPSTKTECDYLNGWIKKKNGHICKNLIKNGELQRYYSWGTQKKKKKKKVDMGRT